MRFKTSPTLTSVEALIDETEPTAYLLAAPLRLAPPATKAFAGLAALVAEPLRM